MVIDIDDMKIEDDKVKQRQWSVCTDYGETGGNDDRSKIPYTIVAGVTVGICLIGMVGNIIVFWYLLFRIQKNKYTVYIINLAVADFTFLICAVMTLLININSNVGVNPDFKGKSELYLFLEIFYDGSLYSGMYFLTAISMERCLSVLFPIWYQCHRPKNLSVIMVSCLWILGYLESLIANLACTPTAFIIQRKECTGIEIIKFVLGICICLPLMILSSLTLLIKIKKTFRKSYPKKLYIIIITSVFVFILAVTPFTFLWFLMYFRLLPTDTAISSLFFASVLCTSLNCTINPYIYFIVGRRWNQKSNNSIHEALQQAFKVEEDEQDNVNTDKTRSSSCLNYTGKIVNIP
ncbi:mas-related G-protein coupled receptor member H-like [Rhinophrynus dorsalis]